MTDESTKFQVGDRVQVYVIGQWFNGTVISVPGQVYYFCYSVELHDEPYATIGHYSKCYPALCSELRLVRRASSFLQVGTV